MPKPIHLSSVPYITKTSDYKYILKKTTIKSLVLPQGNNDKKQMLLKRTSTLSTTKRARLNGHGMYVVGLPMSTSRMPMLWRVGSCLDSVAKYMRLGCLVPANWPWLRHFLQTENISYFEESTIN